MALSNPALLKLGSHLGDRILWFDGSMTVDPSNLLSFMRPNINLHVTDITADVRSFNLLADKPITVKDKLDASGILPDDWVLPAAYYDIDLDAYFAGHLTDYTGIKLQIRQQRVEAELAAFREADKEIVLRLMIYIVDTLTLSNSVWGIGRGSSVSCYLLYLIGVHDIDSVEFDLNFSDFMKST